MAMSRLVPVAALALAAATSGFAQKPVRQINTVKQKLAAGKQVVGGTVSSSDPDIYCAMARAGFDFTWIEMQHSALTFSEVQRMLGNCKGSPAIPFIRVPDATEGDIQKAVDVGALGIIVPMVDTVEKAQNAVKFAKYPPIGRRSLGGGQYRALYGDDYREIANDNLVIVAMIENPAGAAIADKIANVPGIDVVFVASTDLMSFSGYKQKQPQYEKMVDRVRDETTKAGRKVGGPHAWMGQPDRPGFHFFQASGEAGLIKMGADVALGKKGADPVKKSGIAPTEGLEKH